MKTHQVKLASIRNMQFSNNYLAHPHGKRNDVREMVMSNMHVDELLCVIMVSLRSMDFVSHSHPGPFY